MKSIKSARSPGEVFLGVDGGGTRTVALAVDEMNRVLRRSEFGAANVKLLSDAELVARLREIGRAMPRPVAVGIGLAGAWAEPDSQRIRKAAGRVWPGVSCQATNDLETALLAAQPDSPAARPSRTGFIRARVLVLSGTGSCAFGKLPSGEGLKIGGWGHVLGDKGSAYQVGMRALRTVVDAYDCDGKWPALGSRLLRALLLNEPGDLIGWAQSASKTDVARLAVEVFAAEQQRDPLARAILTNTLSALREKALLCARRIAPRGQPVEFVFAGSVLLKQPRFAARLARQLRQERAGSVITRLQRENVWGAVAIARGLQRAQVLSQPAPIPGDLPAIRSRQLSPTEQRNPRSLKLDRISTASAVRLMITEDARIHPALLRQQREIEQAVRLVVRAFRRGGRLFYVGAGTSGRLGVLDASECPVTFRTPPDLVQGIIAGGQIALWQPVEGAEDDALAGARAIRFRRVNARDVVLGIAASGTTRFVWGALQAAGTCRAHTVLLAFNPFVEIPRSLRPDVSILPDLGPEVLTGSTRLKAGGATKLVLNTLTTLAMVQIGKVASNLMVDVVPTNVKLRDRATRIVRALTGRDYETAQAALQRNGWVIKTAAARLARKSSSRRQGTGRRDTMR